MKSMKLQSVFTIKYRVVFIFILFILLNKVVWWVDVKSLMQLMPMRCMLTFLFLCLTLKKRKKLSKKLSKEIKKLSKAVKNCTKC